MIVFDLECQDGGHTFEGWFGSSDEFVRQRERGLVTCPHCGSSQVGKALMAPRIARKGNQLPERVRSSNSPLMRSSNEAAQPDSGTQMSGPLPPQTMALMHKLARMQAEALKTSRFVGASFADDARAMHYGEREAETIHGQATLAQAKELLEEGIELARLPFPVIPPEQAN
jgi:hypothetical protein